MLPVLFQISLGFGGFQQMIQNMANLGFFQFLFPFLLALAIFYGILSWATKDKESGKPRLPTSAIGLISLILGFFVMLFASANPGIVLFLQNISGTGLIVGTGILFLIILLGLTGFNIPGLLGQKEYRASHIVFFLLIVAIVVVLFFGAGTSFLLPSVSVGQDFWTIVFFLVILAVVLWFLGGKGEKEEKPAGGGGRQQ